MHRIYVWTRTEESDLLPEWRGQRLLGGIRVYTVSSVVQLIGWQGRLKAQNRQRKENLVNKGTKNDIVRNDTPGW